MNHDRWRPPLHPGQLFQRVFGNLIRRVKNNLHFLRSFIGYFRINHNQEPITFGRLFSSLGRLVASLLVLPGWSRRKVMANPPPPAPGQVEEKVEARREDVLPEKKGRRKALLIGISQVREKEVVAQKVQDGKPKHTKHGKKKSRSESQGEMGILRGPHRDVKAMKSMLEELYHYEDITVLIDDDDPTHPQPTKANIIHHIKELVKDAKDGDRFFFHYSGHSGQHATTDRWDEEDGMNEYVITCDGDEIMDNELRMHLVDVLPPTCSLTAVLDSCHSCSLLDLVHFRCNRVYVPWLNKGRRRTDTHWGGNTRQRALAGSSSGSAQRSSSQPLNFLAGLALRSLRGAAEQLHMDVEPENIRGVEISSVVETLENTRTSMALTIHTAFPDPVRFIDSPSSARQFESPVTMYCHGNCRKDPNWIRKDAEPLAHVVCLSSAKDSQRTWEDANGNSMTQCLIKILRENPQRTLREVLTLVSHDIHKQYVDLHEKSREYKKGIREYNEQRVAKGKGTHEVEEVEMHNFQNPQLSSHHPLDMSRLFEP